jgi:chondroitin AC lyase
MTLHFSVRFLRAIQLLFCCVCTLQVYSQPAVYDTIMQRIAADLQSTIHQATLTKSVEEKLAMVQPDGSFSGLVYENHEFEHLQNIRDFATAYIQPGNTFYGNEKLYQSIINGLQFWLDKNPHHKNWWFNDISYPQQIGQLLILMRYGKTPLPQDLENHLVERMTRKLRTGDGANTSDEALHYLYRACLTHNQAIMDSAVTYLFEPVFINDGGEGLQADNSYYQHGKQQAIASYGRVFVGNSYNAAYYLRQTPYALQADKLALLSTFFRDTYLKTIRANFYDFNVRGRGISRKDSLGAGLASLVEKAAQVDNSKPDFWLAAAQRLSGQKPPSYQIKPSHNYYWKSNYSLHTMPGYTFSVQTSSNRTLRTERGNNENILGKFLPDGATNIQLRGNEYANIMPVWEWDKIPGVTNRDYPTDEGSTIEKDWGITGTTSFAGGVSDGQYGATAYQLNYDSMQACKAWFFFNKEVVCLGAGISSKAPENITTTINQCWQKGQVRIMDNLGKPISIKNGQNPVYNKPCWLVHDSVGYYFPDGGNINFTTASQAGNWYRINHFQPKTEESGDVFKLWLSHGTKPINNKYAYVVVPGIGRAGQIKKYASQNIEIIKNTAQTQAVLHNDLHIIQSVFYTAGSIETKGFSISVSQPCIVYIKNIHTKNPMLFIADPTQQLSDIDVQIKLPASKGIVKINCKLPAGAQAGATASYPIPTQ